MPRLHGYRDDELRWKARRELKQVQRSTSALRDRCIAIDSQLVGTDMRLSSIATQVALASRGLVLLARAVAEQPPTVQRTLLPSLPWWRRVWQRFRQRHVAFAIVVPKKLKPPPLGDGLGTHATVGR